MRRTPIIALVIGIALVVFIAILFITARPSPAITIRHIKSVRPLIYGITEAFGVTNHTGVRISCYPIEIEARSHSEEFIEPEASQ